MSETQKKEKPSKAPQTQASPQSQYTPDKTLRRVAIEKADRSKESKEK